MRDVPIKFRGKHITTGKYVYGDLIHYRNETCISYEDTEAPMEYYQVTVAPDSIVQLIGYDIDGNEVYEGDALKDIEGNNYFARLEARVDWEGSKTFKYWTLPFEQPISDTDIELEKNSLSLGFFNRVENVRKREKWLKKEEENNG